MEMTAHPFFSIIIPVYNVEDYLDFCLSSIYAQGFKDYEVIIINDGSIDNSPSIIANYKLAYPELVVFHQDNQGQGAARNEGIKHAKGDYIWFVDADDYIEKDSLSYLYHAIVASSTPVDALLFTYSEMEIQDDKGHRVQLARCGLDDAISEGINTSDELLFHLFDGKLIPLCCNKIFSRRIIEKVGFQFLPDVYFEDVYFSIHLLEASKEIIVLKKDLYVYNHRNGSTMFSKGTRKHVQSIFTVLKEVSHYLKKQGVYDKFEHAYAAFYWRHLAFIYLKFIKESDLENYALFLDELFESTQNLGMPYYEPIGNVGTDFPFTALLKFMSENEKITDDLENRLIESFNFPEEFIEKYM